MRKMTLAGAAVAALIGAAPATAQSSFMADVIGSTVANMNAGTPDACYDGRWAAKPKKNFDKGGTRAEELMQKYRQLGAATADVKKLFINAKARWQLDGQHQSVRDLHDPWIARAAKVERVAFTVGNWGHYYHVQWKALAADGTPIGLYDALLNSTATQFTWLDLYSADAAGKPTSNTPFCNEPGDVEKWHEAKAKREAEKAARRAARDAEGS